MKKHENWISSRKCSEHFLYLSTKVSFRINCNFLVRGRKTLSSSVKIASLSWLARSRSAMPFSLALKRRHTKRWIGWIQLSRRQTEQTSHLLIIQECSLTNHIYFGIKSINIHQITFCLTSSEFSFGNINRKAHWKRNLNSSNGDSSV